MSLYVDQDGDLWAKDGDRTYQFTADDPGWTLNAASWDTIERNYGPLVEVPPLLRGEPAKPELVAYFSRQDHKRSARIQHKLCFNFFIQ